MHITQITQNIVTSSIPVLKKYVPAKFTLTLDYVDIFPKSEKEHDDLLIEIKKLGVVVWSTSTGDTYKITTPIKTEQGELSLLRVRDWDKSKTVFRGHPDYTLEKGWYEALKTHLLKHRQVNLITRPEYEMIEIWDTDFDVAVYFPSVPLTEDVEPLTTSTHS